MAYLDGDSSVMRKFCADNHLPLPPVKVLNIAVGKMAMNITSMPDVYKKKAVALLRMYGAAPEL